jgi:hypothetical protein
MISLELIFHHALSPLPVSGYPVSVIQINQLQLENLYCTLPKVKKRKQPLIITGVTAILTDSEIGLLASLIGC